MPTYEHRCNSCKHEWDEFYSMKDEPPTACPSCKEDGSVQRLISGGSGRGIVILKGHDLKSKLYSDAMAARKRASTDEKYRANIIGEDKYHQRQLKKDSLQKDLTRIGKDAAKTKSTSTKPGLIRRVGGDK